MNRAHVCKSGLEEVVVLVVCLLLAHHGGEQVVERAQVLVDDIAVSGNLRAADKLLVEVVMRRGGGAEHDVGVRIRREHHVEQLRQILGIGLVVVGLEDVEQAALLEAMEEHQVTVDGNTYALPDPFIVIATENQVGAAGTQILPHAQMDRFLVRLTLGYPDRGSEMLIIQGRQTADPFEDVNRVADLALVKAMQRAALMVTIKDSLVGYITDLVQASRSSDSIELGISPRGSIAVSHMAKASALMNGRDYVNEEDIRDVFCDVCSHRIILTQKARAAGTQTRDVLGNILDTVMPPYSIR